MDLFFSTATNYLKGESGLPSVLPGKGSAETAKERSRKIRLFCKGLEKGLETFCEIVYSEPVNEDTTSEDVVEDQQSADSTDEAATVVGGEHVEPPAEQNEGSHSATSKATDKVIGTELAAPADSKQDQEYASSDEAITENIADQIPRKYAFIPSDDLFQSLFAMEKTRPTSPGSSSSSSTLVDPSSRKVSPSDSTLWAKGSPTAVVDFANPSLNGTLISDPVSMIDERTKLELNKLLKKKTAEEMKATQRAEKYAARNKKLSAELESVKIQVQNLETQLDVVKTHANALKLSNSVLHAMQDSKNALSQEQDGAQVMLTESTREMTWKQGEEESIQNHIESANNSEDSAFVPQQGLEYSSGEAGHDSNDVQDQEQLVPESDADKESATQEPPSDAVLPHGGVLGTCIRLEGGINSNYEFSEAAGPATLCGILRSNQCEGVMEDKVDAAENVDGAAEGTGPATLWGILRSDQPEMAGKEQEEAGEEEAGENTAGENTAGEETAGEETAGEDTAGENTAVENTAVEETADVSETPSRMQYLPELRRVLESRGLRQEGPGGDRHVESEFEVEGPAKTANVEQGAEGENGVSVPLHLDETVTPVRDSIQDGAANGTYGQAGNAPSGYAGDEPRAQEAEDAPEANEPKASALLSAVGCGDGDAKSKDNDAIGRAHPFEEAVSVKKQGTEGPEGNTVPAPQISATEDVTHDNSSQKEEHGTGSVAVQSSSITAAGEDSTTSEGVGAPACTPSDAPLSSPRAISPSHVEMSDFIPSVNRPSKLSKTQKRNLERKRAKLRKAELKRGMEADYQGSNDIDG